MTAKMNSDAQIAAQHARGTSARSRAAIGPSCSPSSAFARPAICCSIFPRDYLDLSNERPIARLDEGELQTVRGVVTEVAGSSSGFGKSRVSILVQDSTGHLRATWFNQPFMRNRFHEGQPLLLSAKPKMRGMMWEMSHPQVTNLAEEEATSEGKQMLPVYSLTEGVCRNTTCAAWSRRQWRILPMCPKRSSR